MLTNLQIKTQPQWYEGCQGQFIVDAEREGGNGRQLGVEKTANGSQAGALFRKPVK